MCGICGIVSVDRSYPIDASTLLAMRDSLAHRGPDDAGYYLAPGIGLASRRLAIVDLSTRGHMPMSTPDGRYWIIHNGEVYNYRYLRGRLRDNGSNLRTNTDTEVLLHLYAVKKEAMLEELNGMFSFAIWDSQDRTLFLARDRLGIKPLYYAWNQGALYFASEEKALFAAGIAIRFDHETWEELICFRYVAGEGTPFTGVRRLLPGHYLVWRDGKVQIRRWWNLSVRAMALRETLPRDPISWYRETFDDAVRLRRISDVPVGVLLSGGLDSSTVTASIADQAGSGIASFTVRFNEPYYDEGALARQVAAHWQLEGHELVISSDELLRQLRQAWWLNDEPLVHGNELHLLAIAQHAKSRVTVLLSGEGADETLGGYIRYQPLRYPRLLSLVQPLSRVGSDHLFGGRLRKLRRFLELGALDRFVIFNACDVLPIDLKDVLFSSEGQFNYREKVLAEAQLLYPNELVRQAMYSDQHTFLCSILDRNDRMTMGASIECRVPFLDYRLVEMVAALPSSKLFVHGKAKGLLRAALGYRLPTAVLRHRKWGFGVPWKRYLREVEELRSLLLNLSSDPLVLESPLNPTRVQERVCAFLNGNDHAFPVVMQIFMTVSAWHAIKVSSGQDMRPSSVIEKTTVTYPAFN